MSSIDQENLRRAEREIRNSVGNSNEGSGAMWFLAIVVVAAIVGGIYIYGASGDVTATDGITSPLVSEEITPTPVPAE